MTSTIAKSIDILLVEDSLSDVEITRLAFADSTLPNRIHVVSDGTEAIDYLRRQNGYEKAPRPDVILLDLNMPRMDGNEVLHIVKNDPDLKTIPVVVLSGSKNENDIVKSYRLYANCYIHKPDDLTQFTELVKTIETFWISVATLPRGKSGQAA